VKWRAIFTHHRTQAQWWATVEAGNRFKARQECWRALAAAGALDPTVESWSIDGPDPIEAPE
jgi:hypothetical protein